MQHVLHSHTQTSGSYMGVVLCLSYTSARCCSLYHVCFWQSPCLIYVVRLSSTWDQMHLHTWVLLAQESQNTKNDIQTIIGMCWGVQIIILILAILPQQTRRWEEEFPGKRLDQVHPTRGRRGLAQTRHAWQLSPARAAKGATANTNFIHSQLESPSWLAQWRETRLKRFGAGSNTT